MASSSHNPSILLKRLLSLNEPTPLLLCVDSISQTANYFINEISYNCKNSSGNKEVIIVYVSFETINKPKFATHFIDATDFDIEKLVSNLKTFLPAPTETVSRDKYIVCFDSFNYISNHRITQFISSIASPHISVIGNFHRDVPEKKNKSTSQHYPSSLELLKFMASTILELNVLLPNNIEEQELDHELARLTLPRGLNNKMFLVSLTNRRKSGRSISFDFQVDTETHTYEVLENKAEIESTTETPEMLQDLTTFNLTTSAKQKKAKEEVQLPFLEAQKFQTGGAIVYEFEKDDDFDEDDPFEDPF